VLLSNRPPIVEDRVRIGDWEGDLIVGRMSRSAIATLVCRTSRVVRLVHLPFGHAAEPFAEAMSTALETLPAQARLTLTWDQGSEMARHDLLAGLFHDGVFFAEPGSPWQRGTNENTNGLLRQFFPKGRDLSIHTPDDLRNAENLLNGRPRRVLEWKAPAVVFANGLAT
jgi:IS30 family transposase